MDCHSVHCSQLSVWLEVTLRTMQKEARPVLGFWALGFTGAVSSALPVRRHPERRPPRAGVEGSPRIEGRGRVGEIPPLGR